MLSVIIITHNAERGIEECLRSVAFAGEIIVVDAFSDDATVEVCRRYTDQVFRRAWEGYGRQKNFAIAQARGDWVLSVDADERVPPPLRDEILHTINRPDACDAYTMPRQNFFWGRWIAHGGFYPDTQLRLFRRGKAQFNEQAVHERLQVEGSIGALASPLEHHPARDFADFAQRQIRYGWLSAQARPAPRRVGWFTLVARPTWEFFFRYVVRGGFLDGVPGLVYCAVRSWYVFTRLCYWRERSEEQSGDNTAEAAKDATDATPHPRRPRR